MIKTLKLVIGKYVHELVIIGVLFVLGVANFKQGHYLLGWDNYNSEFNPGLSVAQALSAGWSDYRSFGLVAGLSYATDLWRALYVWALSFLIPITAIRYVVMLTLLGIGSLGSYFLFIRAKIDKSASVVGALYYVLNFGTVQIFGLFYEPFGFFFAFLPWAIAYWIQLLKQKDRKNLSIFLVINIVLSGAFYVQTMFVLYMLFLAIISVVHIASHRHEVSTIVNRIMVNGTIILAINSYWLFSQAYFLLNAVAVVQDAKQTLLGWRVTFYQNSAHSTLVDFMTQAGYYVDLTGRDGSSLFQPWLDFYHWGVGQIVQLTVSILAFIGLLDGHNRYKKYMLGLFVVHAIALLMTVPGIREVNDVLRSIPVVDQILRSPFTKLVMTQSLLWAYFIALGVSCISTRIVAYIKPPLFAITAGVLILFSALPAFTGHFIAKDMLVTVPDSYQELFRFFSKQDENRRIVLFPEVNVWGWYTYDWGYTGSGFLWFGIPQPIVSRSYDVWSRDSENYYWEMKTALLKEDYDLALRVLEKYQISYLVIDTSISSADKNSIIRQTDRIRAFLEKEKSVKQVATFGTITIYEIENPLNTSPVAFSRTLSNIGPYANSIMEDVAYSNYGYYLTDQKKPYDAYYPFLGLQSYVHDRHATWRIQERNNYFELIADKPLYMDETHLKNDRGQYEFTLSSGEQEANRLLNTRTIMTDTSIDLLVPKVAFEPSETSDVSDCSERGSERKTDRIGFDHTEDKLTVTAPNGMTPCWGYHFDQLLQKYSYLFSLESTNISGIPLSFYSTDHTKEQIVLQDQLNTDGKHYYVIPEMSEHGVGLSINFRSESFNQTTSKNTLNGYGLYAFPDDVRQIYFGPEKPLASEVTPVTEFVKLTPSNYIASFDASKSGTVILHQAFDTGWRAYQISCTQINSSCRVKSWLPFLFGSPIKDHILVNNWANGWNIYSQPSNGKIYIAMLYWPQYLEYIGFAFLGVTIVAVYSVRKRFSYRQI